MVERNFHKLIDSYVSGIESNYKENAHIISVDLESMPDRDAIVETIHLLRALIFPGYFGKHNLVSHSITYQIGTSLNIIYDNLYQEIFSAFTTHRKDEELVIDKKELEHKVEEIICAFFDRIPDIRNALAHDVKATYDGDPSVVSTDEVIYSFPGIFAIGIYRLAHELYKLSVPLIPRIMTEYAHNKTGIDIHPAAQIGTPFFIDHGTGIVIGETTKVGNYVRLYQGVTLGAMSPKKGQLLRGIKRHPTLEDNVIVYSGATIVGGDTVIGKGAVIGSNVFLTNSVPPGTKVSNKKPELIYKNHE